MLSAFISLWKFLLFSPLSEPKKCYGNEREGNKKRGGKGRDGRVLISTIKQCLQYLVSTRSRELQIHSFARSPLLINTFFYHFVNRILLGNHLWLAYESE